MVLSQYLFFSKKDDEDSQADDRSDELSDERGDVPYSGRNEPVARTRSFSPAAFERLIELMPLMTRHRRS